jgi:hypothetical protein
MLAFCSTFLQTNQALHNIYMKLPTKVEALDPWERYAT